ncbi:hypothetical protein PoB_001343200 [Plakobranchus ocellatus]|uniref:Uncharacterized protein n=1 Tax=Plakobranchus ocellatus TaxID=259542 RepID=A0AAV3YVE1_9GAST|nr:hypothetical protein PoB_001343200 [Plakobranchus ocellatus]
METKTRVDAEFNKSMIKDLDDRNKFCIDIVDEVYVKASVPYRGGVVFDYTYAVDQPGKKGKTSFFIFVKCFFGGPVFMAKILPFPVMKADFQCSQLCEIFTSLESCGADCCSGQQQQGLRICVPI